MEKVRKYHFTREDSSNIRDLRQYILEQIHGQMVGNSEWIYVHKEGLVNTDAGERDPGKKVVSVESENPDLVKLRVSIKGTPDSTLKSIQDSLKMYLENSNKPQAPNHKPLPEGFTFAKSMD